MKDPPEGCAKLMLTERQLVKRAGKGDSGAYEQLVRSHQDQVFHFALYMLPSWQDAEDVTQETFVAAYRAISRFRGDSSFGTWILSIARVKIAQWYRSRRPEDPVAEVPDVFKREGGVSTDVLAIRMAVAELPEQYREVIVMKYVNSLDLREIAASTGLTVTAVGVRLYRARQMLREMLVATCREECHDNV